jgi:hypothetical protein
MILGTAAYMSVAEGLAGSDSGRYVDFPPSNVSYRPSPAISRIVKSRSYMAWAIIQSKLMCPFLGPTGQRLLN